MNLGSLSLSSRPNIDLEMKGRARERGKGEDRKGEWLIYKGERNRKVGKRGKEREDRKVKEYRNKEECIREKEMKEA